MIKIKLLAAAAALIALPAAAQLHTTGTPPGHQKMEAKQAKAKAGGKAASEERRKLSTAQGKQSRKGARQKHSQGLVAPK